MDHGHMTYGMARECYDIVMETSLTVSGKTTRLVISELVYFHFVMNFVLATLSYSVMGVAL